MRILLTYWLIPCLVFIKGFTPDFSGAGQTVNTTVTAAGGQYNKAIFASSQAPVNLSELEFFNDETEDEYSSEKKKSSGPHVFHVQHNSLFFKGGGSFLNTLSSYNCINHAFPHKYIFYRAILI